MTFSFKASSVLELVRSSCIRSKSLTFARTDGGPRVSAPVIGACPAFVTSACIICHQEGHIVCDTHTDDD